MAWPNFFLRNRLKPSPEPDRKPSDNPLRIFRVFGGRVAPNYNDALKAADAMLHPTVHRCLHKLASSVQTVQWFVERDPNGAGPKLTGVDLARLNAVLNNPADGWTADMLRYWATLSMATFGRVHFKIGLNSLNQPNAIYPLAAQHVTTLMSAESSVIGFEYGSGDTKQTIPARKVAKDGQGYAERILMPGLQLGTSGVESNSPLQSVGLPAQIVKILLERAVDLASGMPNANYVISTDHKLTPAESDQIKDELAERMPGGSKSGQALVVSGSTVKTEKLNNDLADIHSKMPLDDMERRIGASFGIPAALMGLSSADAAKFTGNYAESRTAFWEDTLIPTYLSPMAAGLTRALCPPGYRVSFDFDTIPAIVAGRVARLVQLDKLTMLDDDEKRVLAGFEPRKTVQPQPAKLAVV